MYLLELLVEQEGALDDPGQQHEVIDDPLAALRQAETLLCAVAPLLAVVPRDEVAPTSVSITEGLMFWMLGSAHTSRWSSSIGRLWIMLMTSTRSVVLGSERGFLPSSGSSHSLRALRICARRAASARARLALLSTSVGTGRCAKGMRGVGVKGRGE